MIKVFTLIILIYAETHTGIDRYGVPVALSTAVVNGFKTKAACEEVAKQIKAVAQGSVQTVCAEVLAND